MLSKVWLVGGRTVLLLSLFGLLGWAISQQGNLAGLDTTSEKMGALLLITLSAAMLCFGPTLLRIGRQLMHRENEKLQNILPESENRLAQTLPHHETITQLLRVLRNRYGRRWRRKVRIMLLMGNPADVELLAPGLTAQIWQEDSQIILLWGGDPALPPDPAWALALQILCRKPLDGVVWVTSALSYSANNEPQCPPSTDKMDSLAQAFASLHQQLGWQLPVYVWSLHPIKDDSDDRITQSVGCLLPARCKPNELKTRLAELVPPLIEQGLQQISHCTQHRFLLKLANQLDHSPAFMLAPLATLLNPYQPSQLAGIIFSPVSVNKERRVKHHWGKDNRWDLLIDSLSSLPLGLAAKKQRFAWCKILATAIGVVMILWAMGMVISFMANRHDILNSHSQIRIAINEQQPLTKRLEAQLDLQQVLGQLQHRQQQGGPWYSRFGLSQNAPLMAMLWPHYATSALPLIRDAAKSHLEEKLNALAQLPPDSPKLNTLLVTAHQQLKLYLMLARPEKMDAAWFGKTLLNDWPLRVDVAEGIWQGSGLVLLDFYARNLLHHPEWRIASEKEWVNQIRALLVRQMGMRNSESSLYQKMLAQVAHQYADVSLTDMTGNTHASRIFTSNQMINAVPGVFTRKAWNEAVKPAIEKVVSDRREEMDWVLSDSKNAVTEPDSPSALQSRLKDRYFTDFSASWISFLNDLRWKPPQTLSDAIDQLTLMADTRQSPLVALMNTLSIQGKTGQDVAALSDSLVQSAKNLLNRDEQSVIDQQTRLKGPMEATFGPILFLLDGKAGGQGETTLSLQTFLTRVTQVRLKLQQVVNAADPQAMAQTLAQTVFQGKAIDLTDTRDYGSLVAASLGQEWSGFGQTVFVEPMEQAWRQVLTPAAESLNGQWQKAIVHDWNTSFGGRYPFKNTSSEVSLPLLARYLDGDNGRITHFLRTRLNGVLHKEGSHWVPDTIKAQGLTFSPAFLKAINTLSYLSDIVFSNGEAKIHFELRPVTAKDVMQTDLLIDNQKISYYNQLPAWKRLVWPRDTEAPGASLSWVSTQAGTRQYADLPGTWGLIRLLDKAEVRPYSGVSSSFQLHWKSKDGWPLNYTLRTEAGEGPLALLQLRNFVLPAKIFSAAKTEDEG